MEENPNENQKKQPVDTSIETPREVFREIVDGAKEEKTQQIKKETVSERYSNSLVGKEYVYKNHGFYAFRYVCMILSGLGFLASLVTVISLTISKFFNGDKFSISYYLGTFFANVVAMVIIFGILHLILSLTVGKNWKAEDGEKKKYPTVFSVIYCVAVGAGIVGFLVASFGTVIGHAFELSDIKLMGVVEQFTIGIVAICVLGFALIYKLNLFKKINKAIYVMVMTFLALVGVVLFLIFPAGKVRDTVHDNNVVEDLTMIEKKINEYYNENYSLPKSLDKLSFKDDGLHYKLKEYQYGDKSDDYGEYGIRYSSGSSYEICAVFRTDTEDDTSSYYSASSSSYLSNSSNVASYNSYSYRIHGVGKECFTRTVGGSSYKKF